LVQIYSPSPRPRGEGGGRKKEGGLVVPPLSSGKLFREKREGHAHPALPLSSRSAERFEGKKEKGKRREVVLSRHLVQKHKDAAARSFLRYLMPSSGEEKERKSDPLTLLWAREGGENVAPLLDLLYLYIRERREKRGTPLPFQLLTKRGGGEDTSIPYSLPLLSLPERRDGGGGRKRGGRRKGCRLPHFIQV